MTFTDRQSRALRAKLSYRHVKTRDNHGTAIAYVEGWHAIAEANRIFGHDSWDRQTQTPQCVWQDSQRGQTVCFYSTKVRITVRAGATTTIREGIGTGLGRSATSEAAHEMALKAAETDATKRALATFGNPFGLALYDKHQANVTKPTRDMRPASAVAKPAIVRLPPPKLILRPVDGPECDYDTIEAFTSAMQEVITSLVSIDAVYEFWEKNLAVLKDLRERSADDNSTEAIISALKLRARILGRLESGSGQLGPAPQKDKAPLMLPKEKRIRDRDHLAFVASQPCLICGRNPSHAHHLRFAQPRAMQLKVSDEFTVPLCSTHHDALHRTGDERAWWARHGIIEPQKFAARLWAASRMGAPGSQKEREPADRPELQLGGKPSTSTNGVAPPDSPVAKAP